MKAGRASCSLVQGAGGPDMVEMGMGVEKIDGLKLSSLKSLQDALGLSPRINYDSGASFLTTENDAVALKRTDGKRFKKHEEKILLQEKIWKYCLVRRIY